MGSVIRDVRYSLRKLMRTPGFTAVVIATLALAIGATTAVFSIIDGVLLRALPLGDPDRIVQLWSVSREGKPTVMSWQDFADYRARSRSVSTMAAYEDGKANLAVAGGPPNALRQGGGEFEF